MAICLSLNLHLIAILTVPAVMYQRRSQVVASDGQAVGAERRPFLGARHLTVVRGRSSNH
jgi:hypothetical protein